jgi:predicted DNA-binding protein (MmcQ/YjbR family)
METIDGFGHTTFRVGTSSFVLAGMGERGTAVAIKSDLFTQDALIRRGAPWYRTPYIGQHGWISIDQPLSHDWEEVRELIVDGYARVAPKRKRASEARAAPKPPARQAKRKPARKRGRVKERVESNRPSTRKKS